MDHPIGRRTDGVDHPMGWHTDGVDHPMGRSVSELTPESINTGWGQVLDQSSAGFQPAHISLSIKRELAEASGHQFKNKFFFWPPGQCFGSLTLNSLAPSHFKSVTVNTLVKVCMSFMLIFFSWWFHTHVISIFRELVRQLLCLM